MGRPSSLKPEMIPQAEALYADGAIDQEVAIALGVTSTTIDNWKKTKPEFLAALKRGKMAVDNLVEKSLFQNAIEGNTTAQIFWLKNRRPDVWRDRRELGVDGGVGPFEKFLTKDESEPDAKED